MNKKEKIKVSALIKTNNSQDSLYDTLEGLRELDEIIILDEHSKDDTVEIAKEYKAKIIFTDKTDLKEGYKQAIFEAQNDWILFLYDDEIISDEIISQINDYILNPKKNRFCIAFELKTFLSKNKEFKPARIKENLRVFKKGFAQFDENSNELKKVTGKLFKSKKAIIKYAKFDIEKSIQKMIDENKSIIKSKNKPRISLNLFSFLNTFIYFYFIKGSFLYGKTGCIYSYLQCFKKFISQALLFEKEIKKGEENDF